MQPARSARVILPGLVLSAIGGCAAYSALPLPGHSDLAAGVTPRAALGLPRLGMDAVATLAVLNNPDLKAQRSALGVAQAQVFAAGLLPDPQFSYSADHPLDHVISRTDPRYPEYNAYGLGLSVDLQALLTHSSNRLAADATYRQAQLDLLWQEWQTVAQARTLYVRQVLALRRRDFLTRAQQIYALAAAHSQRAQSAGNATLADTGTDQAVLLDVRTRLGEAQRSALQAQQGLRGLLGLRAEVDLPLLPLPAPTIPARTAVQAAVVQLAQHRPDLLALQAGYRAQEAHLRAAVLAQFPDISLGITRARDVSNVHTIGTGVTLTLPLFNRGRGDIAIQRATRAQLRAEYQARLDQAVGDVWQLWNELQQLDVQQHQLEQQLPLLRRDVEAATGAYQRNEFPAASYLQLVGAYLSAQEASADLTQNLWTDAIALAAVLGTQIQPS